MAFTGFFLVLIGGISAFLKLLPEAQFIALKRMSWGRELALVVIFGSAFSAGLLIFSAFN